MEDIRNGNLHITGWLIARKRVFSKGFCYCLKRRFNAFLFVLEGSMDVGFEGMATFHLKEGDFIYFPLHSKFYFHVLSDTITYYICDFKQYPENLQVPFAFAPADSCWYEKHFFSMAQNRNNLSKTKLAKDISMFYQLYTRVLQDTTNEYVPHPTQDKIGKLCSYIHDNITDAGLSVAQIAKHANISEVHLRRLFQAVNGCSPSKYITNARILHAKSLMEDPKLTLQEIAEQSGYSSFTYFSTAFKNATGITPSQYRDNI